MKKAFLSENRSKWTDLFSVESQRNDLYLEEFPEGPYGASVTNRDVGKSAKWRVDQRTAQRFQFENRKLHKGLKRNYPGAD